MIIKRRKARMNELIEQWKMVEIQVTLIKMKKTWNFDEKEEKFDKKEENFDEKEENFATN